MKELLTRLQGVSTIVLGLMAADGWRRTVANDNNLSDLDSKIRNLAFKTRQIEKMKASSQTKLDLVISLENKAAGIKARIFEYMDRIKLNAASKAEYLKSAESNKATIESKEAVIESLDRESLDLVSKMSVELDALEQTQSSIEENLTDVVSTTSTSTSTNEFMGYS